MAFAAMKQSPVGLVTALLVGLLAVSVPTAARAESFLTCGEAGEASQSAASLPNTVRALRERKRIKVLAMGSAPLSSRAKDKGHYALVESFLETTFKGLEIEIIDAGASVELAREAGRRIQNEVALHQPDLVFWQTGVADAVARTPPKELKATLTQAIVWLKEHNVDVVLIGMRYVRAMAKDKHYQEIRQAIRDAQREQAILRVGHYEAIEAIDRIRKHPGSEPTELDLTDSGAVCMADFLSRALAAKLFAKPSRPLPLPEAAGGPRPPPTAAPDAGGAPVKPK
jgi:hypothetical protein